MKKTLLLMLTALFAVSGADAQSSSSQEPNGLDTLVVSKVVRWNGDVAPGEVAESYGCSLNNYGIPKDPPASVSPATDQDTLSINITDTEKEMQISADTIYFYHAVDPHDYEFCDSVFITRFTEYLDTKSESNDNYKVSMIARMGGTLKIFAAPRKKTDEDVEITVTQNGRIILKGTVTLTPAENDTVSINLSAFDTMKLGSYSLFHGTNNYNLTNPPSTGRGTGSSGSGSGGGDSGSKPTRISYFHPLIAPEPIGIGEYSIEFSKPVRIYGIELVQILGRESEDAALVEYPGTDYITKHNVSNEFVKLKDGSVISCIEFENDYTATDYFLEIVPPAGFKKNDVVKVAGVYSSKEDALSQLDVFQIIGSTPDIVLTTNPLVNANSISEAPEYESITLSRAYDRLCIGRTMGSTASPMLTNLRVEGERSYEEMMEDTTTGISMNEVKYEIDFTKPFYNLEGQRVGEDYKGIVIQNGIKMIRR